MDNIIEPWGAFLCYVCFIKNCDWGRCLIYQKLLGLTWQLDPTLLSLAAKSDPKHFQKELTALGSATQQNPIVLGLAQLSRPKTLQKEVGSSFPARPIDLRSGCAVMPKDIIICIINILNFIIINNENFIICVINNIIFTIIKSINIKNSTIHVINIIIITIINSINIKSSIFCVINTVKPWGAFLCCVFCQELRLGALSPLPKAIRSGCQVRPKTLPK